MHLPNKLPLNFKLMSELDMASNMPTRADDIARDAFEQDNAPRMFMSENRIPVMFELTSVVIYIVFIVLAVAVVSIIPGVRRTKFASLLTFVTLITSGATILLSLQESNWYEATSVIRNEPFSAMAAKSFNGTLTVQVGLSSANVTLEGTILNENNKHLSKTAAAVDYVNFNERFYWLEPDRAHLEHINALRKGLPNPILTVTEFLSQDSDGFNWSRRLRYAGYYTSLSLYLAETVWIVTLIIMCCIPDYMPHMIQGLGILMMLAAFIYSTLISMSGRFDLFFINGKQVVFNFGLTFFRIIAVGLLVVMSGKTLELTRSSDCAYKQFTIMDYEPYRKDRLACAGVKIETVTR